MSDFMYNPIKNIKFTSCGEVYFDVKPHRHWLTAADSLRDLADAIQDAYEQATENNWFMDSDENVPDMYYRGNKLMTPEQYDKWLIMIKEIQKELDQENG